ncbi:ImmA/IrrE family metallo-endopeptidase [Rhizobium leguminosarum bv. viciae]|uniref:ImmA/IrrE family metallo-endopeptidase n=1 Tax=Rhizobium ruizarguesonis TaxID=2081791 RepID=UPI000949A4D8|nr:XRE family transcriptional regulator [Rhizobium ruizarguesonis]TCA65336.1 ImmA/IrrE family metallo-endopeptidase [Rhizobium leguminosarum bv. viciae]UED36014.1 XRE family transcriptional regulator [Rhizobium ruizarguesonis]
MPKVNPEILRWARETAGLNVEEAAEKIGLNAARGVAGSDRLTMLEAGKVEPSRPLLLKMAALYRRPILTFYLANPPAVAARGEDFRTLPADFAQRDAALVDTLLREVRARQDMVRAVLEAEEEADRLGFVGSLQGQRDPEAIAAAIRRSLDFDLQIFCHGSGRGTPRGFAYLRDRVEAAGIFVLLIGNLSSHHSALNVELFRGFALADPVAPFVVINDRDSEQAWSFTLLHELAHIWLGQTGVSGGGPSNAVETLCNDVAGSILLPTAEIAAEDNLAGAAQERIAARISAIAESRQVSHSMVAYKLYREGIIDQRMWSSVTALFRQRWLRSKAAQRDRARESEGGPSYYIVRRHKLGNRLVELAKRMLADGALSPSKAATILGVKPSNVYPLTNSAA